MTPRVFISYAREDGEAFARQLRERLTAAEIPLWQDRVGMEGGRDWWAQIAEALNHVEFMVLVMTPAAVRSQTVRREWRHARQQGVCVYPVKTDAPLDFKSLPRWMRAAHFYDLKFDWQKFINDLNTRCQVPRVPFMADDTPSDFVQRPRELDQLIQLLRPPEPGKSQSNVVALCGIGGAGKSLLARAVCHDDAIEETFDQGVLWVTLGEAVQPHDLRERLQDLVETLTGNRPGFTGLDSASARFAELIADRRLLIVIDDVWNEQDAKPFLRGGPECGRLLTTRNINTLPAGAAAVTVDTMNVEEALAVLQSGLGETDAQARAQLRMLARRVGQWPLILKLVNGVLCARLTAVRQPLPQAIAYVTAALQRRGLVAFDERNPSHPHQAVASTLEVSFDQLNDQELARFRELAVFAEDVDIPLSTLTRYWGATGNLDEFETEELCVRLYQLSLLANLNLTVRSIRLHDIVRMYLVTTGAGTLTQLHKNLIDAHRPPSGLWSDLTPEHVYMWDYLAYHLVSSGLAGDLVSTVLDLRYLSRKTFMRGSSAAEHDLALAQQGHPRDAELEQLYRAFVQSAALLNKSPSAGDAAITFFSRIQHLPGLVRLRPAFVAALPRPCFVPTHPLADLPHPALLRTLASPTEAIDLCAASADGSTVAALCAVGLVIWDATRGVERTRISDAIRSFGMAADGSVMVTAAEDGTLRIWDGVTGAFVRSIPDVCQGACAVNGDASLVLGVRPGGRLTVWDLTGNAPRIEFECNSTEKEPISCLAMSENGAVVAAGVGDALMVFRTTAPQPVWVQKHAGKVKCCAVNADGTNIVSGTDKQEFKVWSVDSGDCRYTFDHGGEVNECAICGDGSLALSLSHYRALKLWDLRAGGERTTLQESHPTPAYGCALSRDGTIAVSTVSDGTIHLWDVRSVQQPMAPEGRTAHHCAANGETVLVLDYWDGLEVWDGATATRRLSLHSDANSIWITADGQTVASAADIVRVWNLANPDAPALTFERDKACALSADGSCLVVGAPSGSLRTLRPPTATDAVELVGSRAGVPIAVSPDGQLVVAHAGDGTAKAWDARTGTPLVTLAGDFAEVLSLAVSADKTIAVASRRDGSLTTYDLSSGRPLHVLPGNEEWVRGCSITGSGRFMASARADGSLTLWDVRSGERLCVLHVTGFLFDCAWFSDDERIVAAGTRGVYFLKRLDVTGNES